MATLDDILTTQKNGVVAINALTEALNSFLAAYQSSTGTSSSAGIASPAGYLIRQGSGRVVTINVLVAGTTLGYVYDLSSVPATGLSLTKAIAVIPNAVGTYAVNAVYGSGIIVVTGTGQTASLTYA